MRKVRVFTFYLTLAPPGGKIQEQRKKWQRMYTKLYSYTVSNLCKTAKINETLTGNCLTSGFISNLVIPSVE